MCLEYSTSKSVCLYNIIAAATASIYHLDLFRKCVISARQETVRRYFGSRRTTGYSNAAENHGALTTEKTGERSWR